MPQPQDTTANDIVSAVVLGIQRKLGLTETQCYAAAAADWIEGGDPLTVQVIPGEEAPESGGHGYQEGGGAIQRRLTITLGCFKQLNVDPYRHSEELLQQAAVGVKDFQEQLRHLFSMTVLGGLVLEPLRWEGASAARWHDYDLSILYFDVRISAVWVLDLPTTLTLTAADLYVPAQT